MIEQQVDYKELGNGEVELQNVPDGEGGTISIILKKLTRRHRGQLKAIDQTADDAEERMLSICVTKWGDREGITSQELMHERWDEAVLIANQFVMEFFLPNIRFTKLPG